jgi:hypothetical protein
MMNSSSKGQDAKFFTRGKIQVRLPVTQADLPKLMDHYRNSVRNYRPQMPRIKRALNVRSC